MKKLILILLLSIPIFGYCQNDYDNMTDVQKNIVCISVNMKQDSSFFIDKLVYDSRTWSEQYNQFKCISFSCQYHFIVLFFDEKKLIGADVFYERKDLKSIIKFIDKNLFRVYDKKYKYRWVYVNLDDCYMLSTLIDKKNKKITLIVK